MYFDVVSAEMDILWELLHYLIFGKDGREKGEGGGVLIIGKGKPLGGGLFQSIEILNLGR